MSHVAETADEQTQLLDPRVAELSGRRRGSRRGEDASSIISSHLSKEEQALSATAIGERLPYNDYTTIDWLHDLVSTNPCRLHFFSH
jgi:chloride channel 3/4/5